MILAGHGLALFRLTLTSALLVVLVTVLAGELAMPLMSGQRLFRLGILVLLLGMTLLAVTLVRSVIRAPAFVNRQTGHVQIASLWRSISINPLPALLAWLIACWGITGVGNLTEIYRTTVTHWYDTGLWQLEKPLFDWLLGSALNAPAFWDKIYFQLWVYLIVALGVLYCLGRHRLFHDCLFSAVIAFYVARIWAQCTPAAGPVFFAPEAFEIGGTLSHTTQGLLLEYMAGNLQQHGDIPGTTGMPSLHIALTVQALWYLARWHRASLLFSIPWLALIWLSTLFMGWHYLLDGVAGALVAAVSILLAKWIPGHGVDPPRERG